MAAYRIARYLTAALVWVAFFFPFASSAGAQVSVTPDGGGRPTHRGHTGGYTATFNVQQFSSSGWSYSISCSGSDGVTCTGVSPSSLPLGPYGSGSVTATYAVGTTGTGTLLVSAFGGGYSDAGSYIVPIQAFDAVVTGGTEPTRVPNTGGYTAQFTVRNAGTELQTYSLTCVGSANLTCIAVGPTTTTLGPGASTTVVVGYEVHAAGTGTLTLTAAAGPFGASGSSTVPVGQAAGAPIVDVSPYNYGKQDYLMCAAVCFATVYAQSTVPYFSFDVPRSVTLAYNSDRVNPRPFVHVNVTPDLTYGQTPNEYRLQVKVNGVTQTFVNGDTLLRFSYSGPSKVRLGAQFDASSYATNVYPMDVLITALYAGGPITTHIVTKLLVVNETNSAVAGGWTLAGIQRLYLQTDGSALVTEGDGSAVYFWSVGGTFVSPAGEFSRLVPSTLSGSNGWARIYPDSSKAVFDNTGRLVQLRDRFNNMTTVVYDGSGRIVRIKDPANIGDTLIYGPNGLASIKDPGSPPRTTTINVEPSRKLSAITDPDGVSTTFIFDATLQLWKLIDRRGDTTQFGYDNPSKRLSFITHPPVPIYGVGTVSPTESHYSWQAVGVPYTTTASTAANPPLADTVRARIADSRGFTTTFTVNPWGARAQTTDALGGITTVTYDANGLPIRTVYPTGGVDTAAYNTSGLPIYTQRAGMSAINIRYAAFGQADLISGTGRPTVQNVIGPNGRVDATIVGGAAQTNYTYDSRGRVVSATDPQGHLLVKHTYAGTNGNLSKDSLPGGRVTTYLSDAYGRDTAAQQPGMALQKTVYDVLNRPIQLHDGVNQFPTVIAYDSLFLRSVTDPKGQIYEFTYNAVGWLTQHIDPAGRMEQYAYDRNGNLRTWKNRRADSVQYTYDGLGRVTNKSGSNTASASWTYSPDRRVLTSTSPVETETMYLNVAGLPDSVKTLLAGQTYWRRFRYTEAGLRDSLDISGAGIPFRSRKWIWNTTFGTLSQIHVGGAVTSMAQNMDLQDTSITFPSGDRVRRQIFPLHRTTQISTTAPYNLTIAHSISFDAHGRIQKQVVGDGSTGDQYTYDELSRLTSDSTIQNVAPSATCDGNPPPIIDDYGNSCVTPGGWQATGGARFTYDSASNRRDNGGLYDRGNRILAFAGCTYTTDADGNITSRTCGPQQVSFTWTADSRLASVTASGQTIAFQYDASGWLVRKDVNGAPQSYFLWDGGNLLAELTSTGTAAVAEYSYYGPDRLHALFVGGQEYNAHADGLGNVIALTDGAQTVKRTYIYNAWGELTGGSDTPPFANADRARFKGGLWLGPEVDLYYMRARWYEPRTGRFLSEDPRGLAGGINPYVYSGNDPVNGSDPLGEQGCGNNTQSGPGALTTCPFTIGGATVTGFLSVCGAMGLGSATCGAVWASGYNPANFGYSEGALWARGALAKAADPGRQGLRSPECQLGLIELADIVPWTDIPGAGPLVNLAVELMSVVALATRIQTSHVSGLRRGLAKVVLAGETVTAITGTIPGLPALATSFFEALLFAPAASWALEGTPDYVGQTLRACGVGSAL